MAVFNLNLDNDNGKYKTNRIIPVWPPDATLPDNPNKDEESDKTIDEKIEQGGFITPREFYSKTTTGTNGTKDANQQGYYVTTNNALITNSNIKWFWCEDFKNWCTYTVYTAGTHSSSNTFMLTVWNGKDNWIPIPNLTIEGEPSVKAFDFYNIGHLQEKLILKALGGNNRNKIVIDRGTKQNVYLGGGYDAVQTLLDGNGHAFQQNVVGIKLQKQINYTINDPSSFQTIRWNSVYQPHTNSVGSYGFLQSNARQGITTGIPPVWRSVAGDVFLCTTLCWNGDNGNPYFYINTDIGFRKFLSTGYGGGQTTSIHKLMGDSDEEATYWVNNICEMFFTAGDDKTIEKDWLREDIDKITSVQAYTTNSNYDNMLDSNKVFEQHNINKENSFKCSFRVNRPVVTTEEIEHPDYAKQW